MSSTDKLNKKLVVKTLYTTSQRGKAGHEFFQKFNGVPLLLKIMETIEGKHYMRLESLYNPDTDWLESSHLENNPKIKGGIVAVKTANSEYFFEVAA